MLVKIDYREHALIELLKSRNNIQFEVCPLDNGDIHYVSENQHIIIERKTEADLNSSIKDGRWREQKERLDILKAEGNCEIVFLIEQIDYTKRTNIDFKLLQGAILNTIFRDRYSIMYSECLENTVEYLEMLYKKVQNNDFNKQRGSSIQVETTSIKKKLDKNDYIVLVLSAIPRVSNDIAKKIMEQYSTLDKLVDAYREKGSDVLAEINLGKKKLGKKLSSDIYSYIFNVE
jgi:crossover junction endonuclease MUS81